MVIHVITDDRIGRIFNRENEMRIEITGGISITDPEFKWDGIGEKLQNRQFERILIRIIERVIHIYTQKIINYRMKLIASGMTAEMISVKLSQKLHKYELSMKHKIKSILMEKFPEISDKWIEKMLASAKFPESVHKWVIDTTDTEENGIDVDGGIEVESIEKEFNINSIIHEIFITIKIKNSHSHKSQAEKQKYEKELAELERIIKQQSLNYESIRLELIERCKQFILSYMEKLMSHGIVDKLTIQKQLEIIKIKIVHEMKAKFEEVIRHQIYQIIEKYTTTKSTTGGSHIEIIHVSEFPTHKLPKFPEMPDMKIPEMKLPLIEMPEMPDMKFPTHKIPKFPEMKLPQIEMPEMPEMKFPTPKIPEFPEMPDMKLPEMKLPLIEMPEMPDMKFPTPKIPEFPKMPDMKLPEMKLPQIEMPEMPDMKFPTHKIPKFPEMPDMKLPEMKLPHIEMPDMKFPTPKIPEFPEMPDMKLPEMKLPQIEMPEMPDMKFPTHKIPKFPEMPDMKIPEMKLPQIEMPEMPNMKFPTHQMPEFPTMNFPKLEIFQLPEMKISNGGKMEISVNKIDTSSEKVMEQINMVIEKEIKVVKTEHKTEEISQTERQIYEQKLKELEAILKQQSIKFEEIREELVAHCIKLLKEYNLKLQHQYKANNSEYKVQLEVMKQKLESILIEKFEQIVKHNIQKCMSHSSSSSSHFEAEVTIEHERIKFPSLDFLETFSLEDFPINSDEEDPFESELIQIIEQEYSKQMKLIRHSGMHEKTKKKYAKYLLEAEDILKEKITKIVKSHEDVWADYGSQIKEQQPDRHERLVAKYEKRQQRTLKKQLKTFIDKENESTMEKAAGSKNWYKESIEHLKRMVKLKFGA